MAQKKWQGSKWIRKDKRLAIYLRDGMACAYCGNTMEDGAILSLDHLVCRSHGGSNHESNLITCCKKCNSSRGNLRTVEEFAEAVAAYIDHDATAEGILEYIRKQTSLKLTPFRKEAKAIIARRSSYSAALHSI